MLRRGRQLCGWRPSFLSSPLVAEPTATEATSGRGKCQRRSRTRSARHKARATTSPRTEAPALVNATRRPRPGNRRKHHFAAKAATAERPRRVTTRPATIRPSHLLQLRKKRRTTGTTHTRLPHRQTSASSGRSKRRDRISASSRFTNSRPASSSSGAAVPRR